MCKYCRKTTIILGVTLLAETNREISEKKSDVRLHAYISTSKPEIFFFEKLNKLSFYRCIILGNFDNFSACKYCRKNNAIILGVTLLAATKRVRFLKKKEKKK